MDVEPLREQIVRLMVRHLVVSEGAIATPGDPVSSVRREVLRGLRR